MLDLHRHAVLHDAITLSHAADAAIGPGQLLSWSEKVWVTKGSIVFQEGEENDGLYLLYRGRVELTRTLPPAPAVLVYPGAFFNETVLYSPPGSCTLEGATAVEDCLMLRVSAERLADMQHTDPHKAHQLVLAIFKQVRPQLVRSRIRTHMNMH